MGKKENLEAAMNRFLQEQSPENQIAMVREIMSYVFFVPGVFPPGTDPKDLKPKNVGGKLVLPPEKRPFPAAIKNKDNEFFVPAYLDQAIIKGSPKPEVILQMPFIAMAELTVRNTQMTGIAINPFSQNILLKKDALQHMLNDFKSMQARAAGAQKKQETKSPVSPLFRLETEIFPKELYKDSRSFMERLEKEEGAFLLEVMEEAGDGLSLPSLDEDQFSVMALNIRDALTLIRLDLPEEQAKTKALRAYLLLNEDGGNTAFYTIETEEGRQGTKIMYADPKGKRTEVSEGPTEGVEMTRVLELYDELFGEGETE